MQGGRLTVKELRSHVDHFERGKAPHKYTAVMKDGKRVHFGHRDYEQYRDSVPKSMGGGLWSTQDHGDAERRKNYQSRHAGTRLRRSGKTAYLQRFSPSWFSYFYLW